MPVSNFTPVPRFHGSDAVPVSLARKMDEYRLRLLDDLAQGDGYVGLAEPPARGLHLLRDERERERALKWDALWEARRLGEIPEPEEQKQLFAPIPDPAPETATLLWQGFHFLWNRLPHRLNELGSYLSGIFFDARKRKVGGEAHAVMRVGAYGDSSQVTTFAQAVKSGAVKIAHGTIEGEGVRLAGNVGRQAEALYRKVLPLKDLGMENCDQITVVLRGFEWRCANFGDKGYNTRGFSVRLRPVWRDDGSFAFDTLLKIHPEHAPDRPQPDDGLKNRKTHWKNFVYDAKVHYTVIGTRSGRGRITDAPHEGTHSYSQRVRGWQAYFPTRADEAVRSAGIRGAAGFANAFAAIQGFEWHLGDWPRSRKDGRYLRELEFGLSGFSYDPATGRASFKADMHFANTGLWPLGYDATYRMWNALVQVNDPSFAVTPREGFGATLPRERSRHEARISQKFNAGLS